MTEPVSKDMRQQICGLLDEIAQQEGVTILLAIESGSRAWGFHSPDSDYDVRFIYARPVDWHLSLAKKRDVIERPIDAVLDVSGWELGKALRLVLNSNAVVAEWLQSPITYAELPEARAALTAYCQNTLDRKAVSWHYLSLLRTQFGRTRVGDEVHLKRYFYALRPALALRWMRLRQEAMPPMHMTALVAGARLSDAETAALVELTNRKKALKESGTSARPDPVLDMLISEEITMTEAWLAENGRSRPTAESWTEADVLHQKFTRMAGS